MAVINVIRGKLYGCIQMHVQGVTSTVISEPIGLGIWDNPVRTVFLGPTENGQNTSRTFSK